MNRKVGTSDSSGTDGEHRAGESTTEQGESGFDSANEAPTLKDVQGNDADMTGTVPSESLVQSSDDPTDRPRVTSAGSGAPGDVGQLLRGAYRQTVDEAIPDDLMDLLNKLE